MNKTVLTSFTILCLLFTVFLMGLALDVRPVRAEPKIWTVDDDGPADFRTIQEAINAANSGDTIYVHNGTYYENVVVNKSLSFIGENREVTIINGDGTGNVVYVEVNNTAISDFTIQNSGTGFTVQYEDEWLNSGIVLYRSFNCNISNSIVENNYCGISTVCSSNNDFSSNIVTQNTETGIRLEPPSNYNIVSRSNITKNSDGILCSSSHNMLIENNITNNSGGIRLYGSSNTLRSNSMANNTYNFGTYGSSLSGFMNDVDASNTVDGKPVYYWITKRDMAVPFDAGYVALVNCTHISVQNLNLTNNWQGILLAFTNSSAIAKSNIANNDIGIWLYESSQNSVSGNNIANNAEAIGLEHSSFNNNISRNNITSNDRYGIELRTSSYNCISGNNIENNNGGIRLYYYSFYNSVSGNNISNNSEGIKLSGFGGSTLSGNNIEDNEMGIELQGSPNNNITGNNILNNDFGIWLDESTNNTIFGGNIANNSGGICLEGSSNNTISGSNIINNELGVWLVSSSYNEFYHNNLINNTEHAEHADIYELRNNTWDNGYPSGGNYWSDYNVTDFYSGPFQNEAGGDGIGDTAYVIGVFNRDRYPLMAPIGFYDEGVGIVSDSTLSKFELNATGKTLSFNVTGPDLTAGFCRVTVPNSVVQSLWHGNYTVLVDGEPVEFKNWTDAENAYIYFTYQHSEHKVTIIPEFVSSIILPLLMIATLLGVIVHRRKQQT